MANLEPPVKPSFLTIPEAAVLLRRTPKTLRLPAWRTQLQARKVGGRWLIPREVVQLRLGM